MDIKNKLEQQLYKSSLTRTQNINEKLNKTRINLLTNNCRIVGTENEILSHIKCGPSQNLINSFFKYTTDKCDNCDIKKSKTIQLQRTHCNKYSDDRSSLLKKSIQVHFIDKNTPIKIKDILTTYIKFHNDTPLFILCKKCHIEYDRLYKK